MDYRAAAAAQSASSADSGDPVVPRASLRSFDVNVEKGMPYAAAYANHFMTAAVIGFPDAPPLWHPSAIARLHRHNENTQGHTIYTVALVIPDSCLQAALPVYEALSQVELSTLGFVDHERDPRRKITRWMAGLQKSAAAPRKYVEGHRLQVYVGQTHGAKRCPRQRYNAHYSTCVKNLIVKMQLLLRKLVALSDNPVAKADAARMVAHALFVGGPGELAAMSAVAGISKNLMTTLVEQQCIAWHGSMVDDAGGNQVWPVDDLRMRISPQSGEEGGPRETLTLRLNRYLRDASAGNAPNREASSSTAGDVRNQVLALPWDVVCNSDDILADVLHTHFGHLDPGTVSAGKLQSLLNSYASSQRKSTAKGAKYRAEILFKGLRVWFNRDGVKHAFDEAGSEHGDLDRTMHIHISELLEHGKLTPKATSQTAENLPFFKGCHAEDPDEWPDLTPWGYSTFNKKKKDDRPPKLAATMRPGEVHIGENGERQRYWTQITRKGSRIIPPDFTFVEVVEDEATDMDSSARPSTSGAITVFDAHTTQLRSRVASISACTMQPHSRTAARLRTCLCACNVLVFFRVETCYGFF
jgi:hypothetical protein